MPFCMYEGLIKVIQKILLIAITSYIYINISFFVPTCSFNLAGWKIYPFDMEMVEASIFFLSSAAITIVEFDVWLRDHLKPSNRLVRFLGEVGMQNKALNSIYKNN